MNETGKNKYSQEFKVPVGFDEILRNLTREILRQQPEDINKFGKIDDIQSIRHFELISFYQHMNTSQTKFKPEP